MNSTQIITIKYSKRQAALANYVAVSRASERAKNSSSQNTKKHLWIKHLSARSMQTEKK
jgi:hypothetical protein